MEKTVYPLIHVARIQTPRGRLSYLVLRKNEHCYSWYQEVNEGEEKLTEVSGFTAEEAIRLARIHWKYDFSFRCVHAGFRYTLPERDEHGINALFKQMIASYTSTNGIYFDEELGHNCIVHHASQEALDFWRKLKMQRRI